MEIECHKESGPDWEKILQKTDDLINLCQAALKEEYKNKVGKEK